MTRLPACCLVPFQLATAAQTFLFRALPVDGAVSRQALDRFAEQARSIPADTVGCEAVLQRLLVALSRHVVDPDGLLRRYVASGHEVNRRSHFHQCVSEALSSTAGSAPAVQQAIEIVRKRFGSHGLTSAVAARDIGVPQARLCRAFRARTGLAFGQFVREVRLERARTLLATTESSIKEIWLSVGYKHASDFDHHFKLRYGLTPTAFRRQPTLLHHIATPDVPEPVPLDRSAGAGTARMPNRCVYVVDDDGEARESLGKYLSLSGFSVLSAANGRDALDVMRNTRPAAALVDYRLPDIDGVSMVEELLASSAWRPEAIALLTADWDVAERAAELLRLGVRIFWKPCDPDEIEQWLTSEAHSPGATLTDVPVTGTPVSRS